jgi:hypothetical protein
VSPAAVRAAPSQGHLDPLETMQLALEQSANSAELVKLLAELVKLRWIRTKFDT